MPVTETILLAFATYAVLGIVFAFWFVFRGAARIDPVVRGGTIGFRVLILPGSAVLWPLLLLRSLRAPKRSSA